ncbi:phenylacetic acid degradation protein [Oceanicola sp. 22II-s10i]|uniref:PaaI family thioesterase n=1 Tax=Oceanicola sp. 22II-s10i TaxID=1317116 RepID=UPI000B526C75|nr:PaaI family thioesterase [Oceanicola sp. 22II-s10i]OWU85775.1 phenylacetic acid degradation protein [Oceanicola sp. 22II-s10i]
MKDIELDPRLVEDPYPFQRHLGFYMVDWREDYARMELPMAEFLTNRYGILHGGVYALMCDSVMGYCGCYTGDPETRKFGMTLSLTTNFIGRLEGKTLIAEGWKVGGGRRNYFCEAKVTDELGTLGATASGSFRYRS